MCLSRSFVPTWTSHLQVRAYPPPPLPPLPPPPPSPAHPPLPPMPPGPPPSNETSARTWAPRAGESPSVGPSGRFEVTCGSGHCNFEAAVYEAASQLDALLMSQQLDASGIFDRGLCPWEVRVFSFKLPVVFIS